MLACLRYFLATVCFAASVGCLAWRAGNLARREALDKVTLSVNSTSWNVEAFNGVAVTWVEACSPGSWNLQWKSVQMTDIAQALFHELTSEQGQIGAFEHALYFPLWYPALIFTLVGVGVLRLGRRFSLRSAIVATTVVAGLLGMAAAL
jgi:hypothetical protein